MTGLENQIFVAMTQFLSDVGFGVCLGVCLSCLFSINANQSEPHLLWQIT